MKIIVGLGNPGSKYENTRHNVGFLTLDRIAEELNIKINNIKFKSLIGQGFYKSEKVILVKPQTYMNASGEAVSQLVNFYKINLEDVLVICDDIDIEFGTIRVRAKGSSGTHNGMRNIVMLLGSDLFPRIKISVGKNISGDLANFVLSGFDAQSIKTIRKEILCSKDAALNWIENGITDTMNKFNGKILL